MKFEKDLEPIVKQYQDEGYAVLTHPGADHLPGFAQEFDVDILATRGEERVVVEVKRDRADLEAGPNLARQAEVINAQPGWRYDLIVLNESDPLQRLTREAREPSNEQIREALAHVERLIQGGELRVACVFACAALEAAMRQVARDAELYMPRTTAGELLRTLYGNGFLTREDFNHLNRAFRTRSELVHGLVAPEVDPGMVGAVVGATHRLLADDQGSESLAT
jgi:REase_AHJR-like